jgi:hypothetical protein
MAAAVVSHPPGEKKRPEAALPAAWRSVLAQKLARTPASQDEESSPLRYSAPIAHVALKW